MAEEVIVRVKEKKYRGQTLEHLKSLGTREVSKYLPARSRRSILRHGEVIDKFIKVCEEKIGKKKRIRTHLRDIVSPKSSFRLKDAKRPTFAGTPCALPEETLERRSRR